MSTIQTVIVNEWEYDRENSGTNVYFLEESPEVVKASIKLEDCGNDGILNTRTVYSLEEYMKMQTRPLSDFCPPAPKKGIWWLAVDKGLIDALVIRDSANHYEAWNAISQLDPVKHYHVTLDFGVAAEDNLHCDWAVAHDATSFTVKVKGLAYNDKAACLIVKLDPKSPDCCNKHPHITLATAEGVPPVYSNDMLAGKDGAYSFLPLEAELEGTLEFFQFK
jgi:hypothetical protein